MLDVFSSIGEDVMVGVGCTARRDARNSDLLKIDEIDPTYRTPVRAALDPPAYIYTSLQARLHARTRPTLSAFTASGGSAVR